jgi:hypothetical protein
MKLFQTSQHEIINTSMITNIKPIHNMEVGKETVERLYTKEEYNSIIDAQDIKKCRVMSQDVLWGQVYFPIVAYKVTTTNGLVIISVPDYDRLIKTLSDWLTADASEDEDVADDESVAPAAKLTQDIFECPDCPGWAKWAAMDEDGTVCVYGKKPTIADGYFTVSKGDEADNYKDIAIIRHVTGWQKTLIKREE